MILLEELENVDMLRNLAPEYLRQIALLGQLKEFAAEDIIFYQGKHSEWVFFILEGEVALEYQPPHGEVIVIQTLSRGELLGWSPILERGQMTVTARAKTRCRLIGLRVREIQETSEQNPAFGMEFLRRIGQAVANRLHATRLKMVGLSDQGDPLPTSH